MNPVNNERLINRLQRRLSQMHCAIPNKKVRMDMGDVQFIHLLRDQIDRYTNADVYSPRFYVAFDLDRDDVCSICLENIQNEDQICYAQCGKHVMHSFCLANYLKTPGALRRCQTCRSTLVVDLFVNNEDEEVDDDEDDDEDQEDY